MNWHAHELIFGYGSAVVCGFLFTAIPNWTGRLPVRGWPLLVLVLTWALGRIGMLSADAVGLAAAAVVESLADGGPRLMESCACRMGGMDETW